MLQRGHIRFLVLFAVFAGCFHRGMFASTEAENPFAENSLCPWNEEGCAETNNNDEFSQEYGGEEDVIDEPENTIRELPDSTKSKSNTWQGHLNAFDEANRGFYKREDDSKGECSAPLGMESRVIKDSQITASSKVDPNHAAIQGRLNFLAGGGKAGGWSSSANNANQWIQVAFYSYTKVTKIATQGRNGYSQWVTKYKLQYSDDGKNFHYYKLPGQSSAKVFDGNKDRDSIVYHMLNPPILARYIRVRPTAWNERISMRMELYGCQECSSALGMESGQIKDSQITASSEADSNHAAKQGRLNFKAGGGKQGGWSSNANNANQWIQVDLRRNTKITSIATQGRNGHDQWVTKYKLQYSDDRMNFHDYQLPGQSSAKVFDGNKNRDSIVYHMLNPPIQARYIRLRPTAWYERISMRMELYGCQECSSPLGMESRAIKDSQITASSEGGPHFAAALARLNYQGGGGKNGAWAVRTNGVNQWIQVAFQSNTKITSIATQGRSNANEWVTKYKLQYSDDGKNFHYYKLPDQSSAKVFDGNKDRDTPVYHMLNPPIQARYIRLRPTAWHIHISMRMELYGCKAPGVDVQCNRDNMTIIIPKSLLRGIDREHLRLLDTTCKAEETSAHFTLTTLLTGCNTTRRHTPTAIVYSNTVLEIPVAAKGVVTRVGEIEIQFSCFYSKHGVVSSVSWKPSNRKSVFSYIGKGNFSLSLNMFPDKRFVSPYTKDDFPVAVVLRKLLFFEVSVTSSDKQLSIIADRCYATPNRDRENPLKYEFITKGCPKDVTVKYHSAPSASAQRFSLEAFKFLADHPFVFIHCHVIVCNASDPGSQCAKNCSSSSRGRRDVSDHVTDVYSLAQGPLYLRQGKPKKGGSGLAISGSSPIFLMALIVMCVACFAGTALVIFKKSRDKPAGYAALASGDHM